MLGFGEDEDVGGFHVVESSKGPNSMSDDMGTELEIIRMKIQAIDDPEDDRLPELIKKRRMLEKTMYKTRRMKQIKEDLERLMDDEFDEMSFIPMSF